MGGIRGFPIMAWRWSDNSIHHARYDSRSRKVRLGCGARSILGRPQRRITFAWKSTTCEECRADPGRPAEEAKERELDKAPIISVSPPTRSIVNPYVQAVREAQVAAIRQTLND